MPLHSLNDRKPGLSRLHRNSFNTCDETNMHVGPLPSRRRAQRVLLKCPPLPRGRVAMWTVVTWLKLKSSECMRSSDPLDGDHRSFGEALEAWGVYVDKIETLARPRCVTSLACNKYDTADMPYRKALHSVKRRSRAATCRSPLGDVGEDGPWGKASASIVLGSSE